MTISPRAYQQVRIAGPHFRVVDPLALRVPRTRFLLGCNERVEHAPLALLRLFLPSGGHLFLRGLLACVLSHLAAYPAQRIPKGRPTHACQWPQTCSDSRSRTYSLRVFQSTARDGATPWRCLNTSVDAPAAKHHADKSRPLSRADCVPRRSEDPADCIARHDVVVGRAEDKPVSARQTSGALVKAARRQHAHIAQHLHDNRSDDTSRPLIPAPAGLSLACLHHTTIPECSRWALSSMPSSCS